jgi:hypothetical protein
MVGVVKSCFVLVRADVAEGRVQPAGVVPALDVVEDGAVESCSGWPGPIVDEFALDGGEEGFGHGVIPALALPAYRQHDAVDPGHLGEVSARVLGGLNRSMQHRAVEVSVGAR